MGSDLVERHAAKDVVRDELKRNPIMAIRAMNAIERLPSAQTEPISEEYAKAVRTWLINYQVRCAELEGRYIPYEILGWIVNDWRKENGIW